MRNTIGFDKIVKMTKGVVVDHQDRLETDLLPKHDIGLSTEFVINVPPLDL